MERWVNWWVAMWTRTEQGFVCDTMSSQVPIAEICSAAVHDAQAKLRELAPQLVRMRDGERREKIQEYLAHVRALLLRLLIVLRWTQGGGLTQLQEWSIALAQAERQSIALRKAADDLYFMHEVLPRACAPRYDVHAAMEVLGSGKYTQLPRAVRAPQPAKPPTAHATASALHWLRGVLRVRRASWRLPVGMTLREARGCILCEVAGEYEMALSAQPRTDAPWRLLRLRRLVGAELNAGDAARWERTRKRAQQILDTLPEDPLAPLHELIHRTCCELALTTLHTQAVALSHGGWSAPLKVELPTTPDGQPTALRLIYTFHEASASVRSKADSSQPPSRIAPSEALLEIRPGAVTSLTLLHEPPLAEAEPPAEAAAPTSPVVMSGVRATPSALASRPWE